MIFLLKSACYHLPNVAFHDFHNNWISVVPWVIREQSSSTSFLWSCLYFLISATCRIRFFFQRASNVESISKSSRHHDIRQVKWLAWDNYIMPVHIACEVDLDSPSAIPPLYFVHSRPERICSNGNPLPPCGVHPDHKREYVISLATGEYHPFMPTLFHHLLVVFGNSVFLHPVLE